MAKTTLKLFSVTLVIASIAKSAILEPPSLYDYPSIGTVSRPFAPQTIEGLNLHKAAEALTSGQCAGSTIWHRLIRECSKSPKKMYIVPHAAIEHDGEKCGTNNPQNMANEYVIIVPGEQLNDPRTAVVNGLAPLYGMLSSNARAINAFNILRGVDPVHVGFEYTSDRYCGGLLAFPKRTIYFFLTPPEGGQDLNFGFAYLSTAETGMVSVKEDEELCLYKQSRRLGPGQAPFSTPTPSPTPGRNSNLPGSIFDLSEGEDLPPCFPVQPLSADPTPTPSEGGSPDSSPSASPSISTSVVANATSTPTPITSISPEAEPSETTAVTPSPSQTPGLQPSGSISSPSASPSQNVSDGVCFPSSSRVVLSSGLVIPISDLQIGDQVQSGPGKFSDVFLFTHHIEEVWSEFVSVKTRSNASIEMSPGHYISANGQMRPAESLRVGDVVKLGNGRLDAVAQLETVVLRGLHNPQTYDGSIIVNGIVASTYTRAVDPSIAVPLLVPVKLLYSLNVLTASISRLLFEGSSFFAYMLPDGPEAW